MTPQVRLTAAVGIVALLLAVGVLILHASAASSRSTNQRAVATGTARDGSSPQRQVRAVPTAPPQVAPTAAPTPRPPPFATDWLASHPSPNIDVHAQALILVDADSRQVLWERDSRSERAPASLTKVMTAMVAADLAPLDRPITVSAATDMAALQKIEPDSTVMGLTAGEVLTLRELLYGLFLQSGNDAAETIAAGLIDRQQFIDRMNEKAAALGMTVSHFTTPVGLDEPTMHSTAYDLAVAAAAIVTAYPELLAISGSPSVEIPQTPAHKKFDLPNYNKLVLTGKYNYPGATGMKTAFTDDAGQCMLATAQRNGRRLVAVVLHSAPNDFFSDAIKLLNYGFGLPG